MDYKKAAYGIAFIIAGILLQQMLATQYWQVFRDIERGILSEDTGPLILAGGLLAFLNTVSYLPVFLGAFKLGQMVDYPAKWRWSSLMVIVGAVIVTSYSMAWLNGERAMLAAPLLVIFIGYLLINVLAEGQLNTVHEGVILGQLILASQWLELTPYLDFLGFGRGELTASIQIAAQFLESKTVLNFVGVAFFIPLTLSAGVTTVLINNYSQKLSALNEAKQQGEELQQAKLQAVEARVSQEMHSLVHDLKTPLMTVRGLNSILQMRAADEKEQEYCEKIEVAVMNMSEMISEILYDEVRAEISVEQLINYVRAHVVPENLPQEVSFDIAENLPPIKVNKIRLARALINVIENALKATNDTDGGYVRLQVMASKEINTSDSGVLFIVSDNGVGIAEEDLDKIWEVKFSTGDTLGLGLDFVKKVIENHKGKVTIFSKLNQGTKVEIFIPRGDNLEGTGY